MIRINLLPFRAARKKENIRKQISIYLLSLVLLFAVMGFSYYQLRTQLNVLKDKQNELNVKLKEFDAILKGMAELEKKIKEVRSKLAVIKELEANKTGPVHLLDEIAKAVPKDKLWLSSLKESRGTLTLQGTAMDNETVALFMTNLEKSDYISSVDLQSTRMRTLAEHRLNVSDFTLECKTYAFKEPLAPAKTKK
jgi:type IV pilus assembly protein PilN